MNTEFTEKDDILNEDQIIEPLRFLFGLNRRAFVQLVATGLVIATGPLTAVAQQRRGGGMGGQSVRNVGARIHIGKDGTITVLAGKVEVGQGSRAELSQAAAEELRVSMSQIQLVLADTRLVPDDGITAGSRSTPSTVPAIREAAATAREVLLELAGKRWNVEPGTIGLRDGKLTHAASKRVLTLAELASSDEVAKAFEQARPSGAKLTEVKDWKVLGTSVPRPNGHDVVTGSHEYPSDIKRLGMLHGKVLRSPWFAMRPPSFMARLVSIDLTPARALKDVVVVQDGDFVGVAAPTTARAEEALETIAKTAKWEPTDHPSSKEIFDYLRTHARGGVPENPLKDELAAASKKLRQSYHVAYVQHAPMETRAAVAEWQDGKLTVWTGTQNPFGHLNELTSTFRLSNDQVRVIVPDTGGGFGGKHTGEVSVEAARLAKGAGKPVALKWTREEEFTWAAFRPAAVIDAEATLDASGTLTSWHFVDINAGSPGIETPYRAGKASSQAVNSAPALRQSSYRALAATANNFARESFMDELAAAAGADSLAFRLAHLENDRLRAVLEAAAKRFNWIERVKQKQPSVGVGLACGTEKGSFVAACVEIGIDRQQNSIVVRHVCEAFECGAILNPDNLRSQVAGAIIMGLGPALREAMRFEDGKMLNAHFSSYAVPRLSDLPELDIQLLNRPDLASAGAGETPIIAVAPAIANAVFHATGVRVRQMPIRLPTKGTA